MQVLILYEENGVMFHYMLIFCISWLSFYLDARIFFKGFQVDCFLIFLVNKTYISNLVICLDIIGTRSIEINLKSLKFLCSWGGGKTISEIIYVS